MAAILLVEDDTNLIRLLELYLSKTYTVAAATSGDAATQLLSEQAFDVTIMDLMLVDGPAWNLLSRIRRDYPAIRIIIMTGSTDQMLMERARSLGVHRILPKPTSPADIKQTIETLL